MKLYYEKARYTADESLAIRAYIFDDGYYEPYGDVTVCLAGYGITPNEGEVFLPAYNMFGDFLPTVLDDIVDEVLAEVQIGYGRGLHVRLKKDWENEVDMLGEFS